MRDAAAVAAAAVSAWLAVNWILSRPWTTAAPAVKALGPSPGEGSGQRSRAALLAGLAAGLAQTRPGARLAAYARKNHPSVAFSDFFAMVLASLLGGAIAGAVLFPVGPLSFLSALAGPAVADRVLIHINGRRTARIERALPDALSLQAAALRAGNSLTGSLRLMAADAKSALGEEIGRTVSEVDLGDSVEDALRRLAVRAGSGDVDLWVTAMLVHRTTGGNLTVVVDGLAGRVRGRLRLRGEIRALTAQGRISGLVVALAPLAFLLLMSATAQQQMKVLYETPTGWLMLVVGLAMEAAGFLWIRFILRVRP